MTTPLSLEQRILIAAEYNADRVEAIKELMKDNAVGFKFFWDNFTTIGAFPNDEELYTKYLQSNKQVKP